MKRFLAASLAILLLASCSTAAQLPVYDDEPQVRGAGSRVEQVGSYRAITLA